MSGFIYIAPLKTKFKKSDKARAAHSGRQQGVSQVKYKQDKLKEK